MRRDVLRPKLTLAWGLIVAGAVVIYALSAVERIDDPRENR